MTRPSDTLDAIRRTFDELLNLGGATTPRVWCAVVDEQAEDLTDRHTIPNPAVLVSCLGLSEYEMDASIRPFAVATFVARVYARLPKQNGEDLLSSKGDVAMDIAAALIAQVKDHIFLDDAGEPVVAQVANSISARNRSTMQVEKQGHALWLLTWTNLIELDPPIVNWEVHPFRHLHITHHMGDEHTPDAESIQDLEGREP